MVTHSPVMRARVGCVSSGGRLVGLVDLPVDGRASVGPAAAPAAAAPRAHVDEVVGKEANNLLLFTCYLYVFNTVYHGLVFELLEKLAERFLEVWLQLRPPWLPFVGVVGCGWRCGVYCRAAAWTGCSRAPLPLHLHVLHDWLSPA